MPPRNSRNSKIYWFLCLPWVLFDMFPRDSTTRRGERSIEKPPIAIEYTAPRLEEPAPSGAVLHSGMDAGFITVTSASSSLPHLLEHLEHTSANRHSFLSYRVQ